VQAEALMEAYPDSARQCIEAIQHTSDLPEDYRMRYCLLSVYIKAKTGSDISNDTLIVEAKNYFLQQKDFPRAALAAFYSGRVWQYRGDNRALQAYLEAGEWVEHIADSLLKGRVVRNIGLLYYDSWADYQSAIPHLKNSRRYI
jgi:hypothetical protein